MLIKDIDIVANKESKLGWSFIFFIPNMTKLKLVRYIL